MSGSILIPERRKKHLDVVGLEPRSRRSIHYTMVSRAGSIKITFQLWRGLVNLMRGSYGVKIVEVTFVLMRPQLIG